MSHPYSPHRKFSVAEEHCPDISLKFRPTISDVFRCEKYLAGEELKRVRKMYPSPEERDMLKQAYSFTESYPGYWSADKDICFRILKKKFPDEIKNFKRIYEIIYMIKYCK